MIKCPKCNGVPVAPWEPKCQGCLDCDFTGTLEAFLRTQAMIAEAYDAWIEFRAPSSGDQVLIP